VNERKRLYSTLREEREKEELKEKLGLARTAIAKGGGMPEKTPREEVRNEEVRTNENRQGHD